MSVELTCPVGHRWRQESPNAAAAICPVCGGAATPSDTVDLSAADHVATTRTYPPDGAPPTVAPAEQVQVPGYEILRVLGRGGMGVVYLARQVQLNRLVALKMILAGGHASAEELQRFLSEAEAVAAFQHPNIVHIYEVGRHGNLPYMALEYVEGGSLADRLKEGSLSFRDAAHCVEQMARAMNAAHQAGIVHRDLKPGNVLLTRDGTPKITDFGLAKRVAAASGGREPAEGLTQTGAIMGTPGYMAPEQAGGETKRVGPAADVYALGAILYRCLTGRAPFEGGGALDVILQVTTKEPAAPRQVNGKIPKDLETICLKCLHKEPAKRYASAEALAEDLRRWRAGEPISARPVGRAERAWSWCRRHPWTAAVSAGFIMFLVTAAAVMTYLWGLAEARGREALANLTQAEKNFDTAWKFVDDAFVRAEKHPELKKVVGARADLIDAAIRHYTDLTAQRPEDAKLQYELAKAHLRRAQLHGRGNSRLALAAGREALALLEDLHHRAPTSGREDTLATAREVVYIVEPDEPARRQLLQKLLDYYERRIREKPEAMHYSNMLGYVCYNKGLEEANAGRPDSALRYLERSRVARERVVARPDADPEHMANLALTLQLMAQVHFGAKRRAEAAALAEQAVALRRAVVRRRLGEKDFLDLAETYDQLAGFQKDAAAVVAQAEKACATLEQHLEEILVKDRTIGRLRCALAIKYNNVGLEYMNAKQQDRSLDVFERGCRLLEQTDLAQFEQAFTLSPRYVLATMSYNIGQIKAKSGSDAADGPQRLLKGCTLLGELAKKHPDVKSYQDEYRQMLLGSAVSCGMALFRLRPRLEKEPKNAALRQVIEEYERVQKSIGKMQVE